jgi:CHAD domain-containing protein
MVKMASFAALLRDRAKDLTKHLAAAIKGEMRGVHQGRVASRRLRESLPAAGRQGSASRARKSFREITRALGPVRELDVVLAHLSELNTDLPPRPASAPERRGAPRPPADPPSRTPGLRGTKIPRIAIERVRTHVREERERRRERMLVHLERVDLAAALSGVESVAGSAPPEVTPEGTKSLLSRVHDRARTLQTAVDAAGTLYHPERLHSVRIAGKKLRYSLEVVSSTTPFDVRAELRLLKRAQERLGVMHDYQILLEHVAAVREATPPGAPGAAGLKTMANAYDRECRDLHADYLKMAPALAQAASKLRQLGLKVRNTRVRTS